jgi:5'-nucleotidase
MKIKPCLFDLDGTLCDHTRALMRDLALIQSPSDPSVHRHDDDEPVWVRERKRLIRSQTGWWRNLEKIDLGFQVYRVAREIGFSINVLTKGPWTCANAWSEKVEWCRIHLDDDVKITISEDKSIVYGRVLVDDYVPYVVGWLNHRPRGLVVMVANEENRFYIEEAEKYCRKIKNSTAFNNLIEADKGGRIVRYDGSNLDEVIEKMQYTYDRD